MIFQGKVREASADLRARAGAIATAALHSARARIEGVAQQAAGLRQSLIVLNDARREFRKVARRHVSGFVRQNVPLVAAVRKDVSALARSTYSNLAKPEPAQPTRRAKSARKRTRKAS